MTIRGLAGELVAIVTLAFGWSTHVVAGVMAMEPLNYGDLCRDADLVCIGTIESSSSAGNSSSADRGGEYRCLVEFVIKGGPLPNEGTIRVRCSPEEKHEQLRSMGTLQEQQYSKEHQEGQSIVLRRLLFLRKSKEDPPVYEPVHSMWAMTLILRNDPRSIAGVQDPLRRLQWSLLDTVSLRPELNENTRSIWELLPTTGPLDAEMMKRIVALSTQDRSPRAVTAIQRRIAFGDYSAFDLVADYGKDNKQGTLDGLADFIGKCNDAGAIPGLLRCFKIGSCILRRAALEGLYRIGAVQEKTCTQEMIVGGLDDPNSDDETQYWALKCIWKLRRSELSKAIKGLNLDPPLTRCPSYEYFRKRKSEYLSVWKRALASENGGKKEGGSRSGP
jgi:hypothetical protein